MINFVPRSISPRKTWTFKRAAVPSVRQANTWSIRSSLALLAVACILPGALMSSYFIVSDYRQQKARAVQEAIATARAAAASLDRDLASIEAGLHVLAISSALDTDDLTTFHRQAKQALPFQNITNYVLIDAEGRQRLNTILPPNAPLPAKGGPSQLHGVFTTGSTVVTDLFMGPATGKPILAIGVPVTRNGRIIYSLNAGIFPDRLAKVLLAQRLPPDWIGAVVDSQGKIVARTHELARFQGKPAVPDLVRMAREQREGVLETITLDGIPVITAFSRSTTWNWTVAVGVPKAGLNAGLKQSLALLLLANTLLSVAAMWLAWRLALAKVVYPAHRLLARMGSLSRGVDPGPPSNAMASHEFVALEQGFSEMGERLRQQERERRAKAAAEAANQAKTDFLSRMSHELRTPLNAVLGFAQVLKMNTADPLSTRQLGMVNQIESSGLHLLEMISDVLDVSKIESDAVDLFIEDVDVRTLTRDCQQMLTSQVREAGVHMEIITQDGVRQVRADRTRLKQVLLNLLSNAVKYNRRGGQVSLILQAHDGQLTFRVRDTGMGMTREQVEHLFEPFNRLGRENTATPGTGIGLVICKRLLELMGSSLSVRTIDKEGSEFQFTLPATGSIQAQSIPASPIQDAKPGQRKVLYVEDRQTNRDTMTAMLGLRPQIDLIFEHSAQAAKDRLEREAFDLVMLDLQLPDGHGLNLLAWLSEDRPPPRPPVVIVSADVSADTKARAERAGAVSYLQKPLDLKLTLEMLDSLLHMDAAGKQPSSHKL
ncbi:ATP-binding protein [Aquabacterium sp.]|uniref:hybrid sensor histidine kinase/response regulator n=1 Tax=Aquabacterium sp. TaxID=1872578 RepID=UPI0024884E9E|nr:ATP-binding protein [Aquabacterium sp.]MDI1258682.1 ATP-binding protein [Aquabacterium sp.]